jgi:hypothetical protein
MPGEYPEYRRDADYAKIPTKVGEYYSVPAGTYYMAAGRFTRTNEQVAIIEGLKQGLDLSAMGVPKVTLTAGVVNKFELDSLAAVNAARVVMRNLRAASVAPASTAPAVQH